MNTQNINNNNIESKNGMSQVVIDLRPQVKHHEGYGREKVADVYFRTQVRAYSRQVYGDYSQEAHEAAEKALTAFYSEVVELLKGEGWTLLNDYAHWHTCPELTKGAQYLYVHPDSISGEVNPADIDALEAKFKALTACEYRGTDNYGDIILTRSEADERTLYRETYTEGIAATVKECTTTKRSNLYKDRGDALGCIRNRIAIQNKRTDLTGHGTGYYRERKAVAGYVQEEYDRLLQAGYIKEATGQNGRTLCRWINKKEEKELTKARREAEKAEKERKAQEWQEYLDREAEKQASFAEGMRVTVPAASLTDGEAFVIIAIRRKAADNGGNASLTVKSETTGEVRNINGSDVIDILPPLEPASEIKTADVLQVGTMVRMPGVIGGLRVEEIDRKGDRVICVDGCKERHTYKGLDYFTATAEEICIPEWLRICQYFYIGPKGVKTNRVLCTDIIPCSDQEKPVVIVYSDYEGKERKIFLSAGLDNVNRTDIESLTAKYQEQIVNNMQLGCGCMVSDGTESKKDSQWVKVRKAYTNDSRDPKDWTYCVCWYDVEPTDRDGYRETLRECENGVRLEQAARALAQFEIDCKPTLETSSEITDDAKAAGIVRERQEKPGTVNTSWATDFTPEDFQKLTSRYEVSDEDCDIVGRRFRFKPDDGLFNLSVFVADYAGNEAHALIYVLDEFMGTVRANVLPIDKLRGILTEARGWQQAA